MAQRPPLPPEVWNWARDRGLQRKAETHPQFVLFLYMSATRGVQQGDDL